MKFELKSVLDTSYERKFYSMYDRTLQLAKEHPYYNTYRAQKNGVVVIVRSWYTVSSRLLSKGSESINIIIENGKDEYTEHYYFDDRKEDMPIEELDTKVLEAVSVCNEFFSSFSTMREACETVMGWNRGGCIDRNHTHIEENNHFFRDYALSNKERL